MMAGGGGEPAVFVSAQAAQPLHGDAAYGDPGVEELETFLDAHALYDVIWQAFEARRRPQAMERAAAGLAHLRGRLAR